MKFAAFYALAVGILMLVQWTFFLLAAGMVTYAMVNSAGYFAQSGDWVFMGMFGVLLILAGVSIDKVIWTAGSG